ncbi:hypothetical protein KOXY103107_12915 [Komagataeibacter xylinus]
MPGRTGSGIAVRRPACRHVGEPILSGVPEGCVGQNWGDHASLTRFALAHGTMGRLRESLVFLLRLTSGDQHDRPRHGRARQKTRMAPPGETGRGWVWEVQSPFRLRGRVQMRV